MESIRLENIKSFKDSGEIELRPITIFVGKNGCGKSSIMRLPVVMKQSFSSTSEYKISFAGNLVDYGNIDGIKHYGARKNEDVSFTISEEIISSPVTLLINEYIRVSTCAYFSDWFDVSTHHKVSAKYTIKKTKRFVKISKIEYSIDGQYHFSLEGGDDGYALKIPALNMSLPKRMITLNGFVPYVRTDAESIFLHEAYALLAESEKSLDIFDFQEKFKYLLKYQKINEKDGLVSFDWSSSKAEESADEKSIKISKKNRHLYDELIQIIYDYWIIKLFNEELNYDIIHLSYIGPFRDAPHRVYRDKEGEITDVGYRGEGTGQILLNGINNKKFIKDMSKSLSSIVGLSIKMKEVGDGLYQIVVVDKNGIEVSLIDTGYGTSMVLPIVTQSILRAHTGIDGMFIIEEPELHLHPAAQAELADLFAKCALGAPDTQMLIETHSEHLIRKLQVLIADPDCELSSDMVKFYYVDKDDNGDAHVKEMEITEKGRFKEKWPTGFFDEAFTLARRLSSLV